MCPRWCSSWKIPHGAGQGSQETTAAGEQQPLSPALCGLAAPHATSAAAAELQLQGRTLRRMQQRSPGERNRCGDGGRLKKYKVFAGEGVASSLMLAVQRRLMDTVIPPNSSFVTSI